MKARIEQIRRGEVPEGYKRVARRISPQEWEKLKIGDVYTERKEPGEEGLPILTVSIHSGVSDGELDEDEIGKKVRRIEDKSQYKKAMSGDLVFNMMRAWQGAIGVVRTTGMVSPAYIVAKPSEKLFPPFMDDYMRTPTMIQKIHSQSYGVTDFRLRLYWDSFAPIDCCLPSIAEQQKIASILTTQDKVIELKEKLLGQKQRQKKALMQQLLTGKKRLPGFNKKRTTKTIEDVCEILDNQRRPLNASERNGRNKVYPYWGANGIVDYIDEYIFNDSLILLAEDGGNFSDFENRPIALWVTGKCWVNNHAHILKPHENVCAKYIFYSLEHSDIRRFINGTTRSKLTQEDMRQITIVIPECIEEQTAIAEILSTADREIDLLQKEIEQEKQKKKALMQMLLTGIVRVTA